MRILAAFFLTTLLITSCGFEDENPAEEMITQRYEILPWQSLSPSGSEFQVIIKSLEVEQCTNAVLDASVDLQADVLNMDIFGNGFEGDCEEGESFPEAILNLPSGEYQNNLVYTLDQEDIFEGRIDKEESRFKIDLDEATDRIVINESSILKIKEPIFWGFLTGDDPDMTGGIDMLEGLVFLGPTLGPPLPRDGNYGHFKLEDGTLTIPNQTEGTRGFIYPYHPGFDWNDLDKFFKRAKEEFPSLKYQVFNYDGQVFEGE